MKITLRIFALIIAILSFNHVEAQKANYTTRNGITMGFGMGGAFQQSDIANSIGIGYDFTFGSQLYKKEGAFLSADWKFRFLAGANKAHDHRINLDGSYSNINYKFFNYDLELGLSLNRLRERTRIVVSGFAGAGITHGRTFTDLVDESFNPYDYTGIDPNRDQSAIYKDLLELSDGNYETALINKAALLPTAGLFIGYQFSPSFSLGIEHKANFSLSEQNSFTGLNMDNNIQSGSKLDGNHYTTIGFKWNIGHKSGSSNYIPSESTVLYSDLNTSPVNNNIVATNPVVSVSEIPPRVEITDPGSNPYRSSSNFINIKAVIMNAEGYNQISFYQDGIKKTNFTYNNYSHVLSVGVNLNEGENSFRIVATNSAGTAQARQIVILDESQTIVPAPVAVFTSPSGSQFNSSSNRIDISARIQNVSEKADIKLILNGRSIAFDFLNREGIVRTSINLNEGTNSLEISASNPSGTSRDHVNIIYNRPVQEIAPLPMVRFINPHSPVSVQNDAFLVKAETAYVGSRYDVSVSVNGTRTENFNFNSAGEVNLNIGLMEGLNSIEIIVINESGQRTAKTFITYTRPVRTFPPAINISKPSSNPYRSYESDMLVRASVTNIQGRENISFAFNNISSNNYRFNVNTGEFSSNIVLKEGQNILSITADNGAGRDVKTLSIIKEMRPCPMPEIYLPELGAEIETTDVKNYVFKAELRNILRGNQLELSLNQVQVPFNFNGSSLSYNASLREGINSFVLKAKNECGEESIAVRIKFSPVTEPAPCYAPLVNFSLIPVDRPDATHDLRGKITNVKSKSSLRLIANGRNLDNYQFSPETGAISGSFNFNPGTTSFVISATNDCGNDSKSASVFVEEPCQPPTLKLSLIPVDRIGVTHELRGKATNIESVSNIVLTLNGKTDQNFRFNSNNGELSGSYKFESGRTTLMMSVLNECGSDSKSVSVSIEEPCLPPTISASLNFVGREGLSHELSAFVKNINSKSDISINVNGSNTSDFHFQPSTGALSSSFNFSPGISKLIITATNECGSDSKSMSVSVEEPCEAPKVEFSLTEASGADATHNLRGSVSNIKNKSDIKVTVNGRADQGFQFVPATGVITSKYKFGSGTSTVVVSVKNECGSDSKSKSVSVEEPCEAPKVEFSLSEASGADATHNLRGSVSNIKNKSDIKVTINGRADQGFQFVPATGVITSKYKFSPGTSTVVVSVKNECGSDSKSKSVRVEEPCEAPKVEFSLSEASGADATHNLRGSVSNIKNKSDIKVTVNGRADQGFQFVPTTGVITSKYKFSPGTSTVVVSVQNECGSDSKSKSVRVEEPCEAPKVEFSLSEASGADATHNLRGSVSNIKNKTSISVKVNGRIDQGFQFVPATGVITSKYKFAPGTSTVVVSVQNECGSDSKRVSTIVEEPVVEKEVICGVRINPENSEWEFCLQTPRGTYNRESLENKKFTYSGPATSLYFKPIGGGGDAFVNGKKYKMKAGSYYLFSGRLSVKVGTNNPGSMGQWSVCIESDKMPITGNGNSRPKSPCESD